jgi:hypothetical protein
MAQRRRSITFAHAHWLSIAAALLIPPLVAYAPEHCQLAACLLASFLLGLVGLVYRVAFQNGREQARQDERAFARELGRRILSGHQAADRDPQASAASAQAGQASFD